MLGAAYLLYLAWKTLRSGSSLQASAGLAAVPAARIFRQGLFTNILNPKMALFVLALFPQFIDPHAGSLVVQMLLLATVLNLVGLVINGGLILAVSGMKNRFCRPPLQCALAELPVERRVCRAGLQADF
jgi:threonine/homoserine/homoserine lactone efflux protein